MKRCYRFFGGFLDTQANWLNKMAKQGWRLIETGKATYDFEKCQPGEYQYALEFVAHQSYKKEKQYRAFLEDLGYTVFYKNANLNYSIGKIKWRPYGKGMGQIATNPGSYNKEIFIVEKKNDGAPFELHTTNLDKVHYYIPLRNAWLSISLMFIAFSAWSGINKGGMSIEAFVFGLLGLTSAAATIKYQQAKAFYARQARVEE